MISNRFFFTVLTLSFFTCIIGMILIPVMDIDASQYASISRELLAGKNFLQFYDMGADYLDKPPMLFWLSAISLKIFGIYDWAYRLPSFVFALIAVYATFRLAFLWYGKTIAQLSAMILATSQAFFLITHDVRCDTMLMGWVMLSLWQLSAWFEKGNWKYFFTAFVAIAGGMLTKGPIALIVPVLAFLPHFILKREWKQLFRWEYIIGILIIAVLLIPMSIGLYQQYDLHPGKLINGHPIQSGLRFYYWTQSFGRYTGENVYHEMSYFTFLLENMLWSFLPWIVFFLVGLGVAFWDVLMSRFWIKPKGEFITVGGFFLTYCILARSQAQLPHYIFVVFPLAAIISGVVIHRLYFMEWKPTWSKLLYGIHAFVFTLLWLAVTILMYYPFKEVPILIPIFGVIGLIINSCILFKKIQWKPFPSLILSAFFTIISVNILLSTHFYPNLLKYQMGNTAADYINQHAIDKQKVVLYGTGDSRALHFYGNYIFKHKNSRKEIQGSDILITSLDSIVVFKQIFPQLKTLHSGANFSVSLLTAGFLNPKTREHEMPHYVILDLDGTP